jgi:NAD(P)-dependent dehydrogenase (short-subunit alcohol dehydrogenase family)
VKLQGKVALVTGTSPNIGGGIAEGLADEGAKVICVDISPDNANQCAARVQVNPRPWEWRHEDGSMKLVIVTQSESSDELGISPT